MKTTSNSTSEKGSIFVLILVAVALFAALFFAVSQNSRVSQTTTTSEKAELTAGRILNFASSVQSGVMRLKALYGVSTSQLKYNNNTTITGSGAYQLGELGSPADPSLYLFHPHGGGVAAQTFDDATTPCEGCGTGPVIAGRFGFYWVIVPGAGTNAPEAVMLINDLHKDACLAINKKVGINEIPDLVFGGGAVIHDFVHPPTGLNPSTGVTNDDYDAVFGKPMYCFKKNNSPVRYVFVMVLETF